MAEASIETLASGAIAAGCLQAVMSMVHPELVKFVAFQKQRVARRDAEQERNGTSRHFRRRAADADAEGLSPEQQTDVSFQLKYLRRHWHSHLRFFGLDAELPAVVQRALLYRNKVAHQSQLTLAQYEHAIATFERLADIIECNTLIRQQIRELVAKLLSFSSLGKTPEATNQVEDKPKMKESKTGLLDPVSLEPTPPPASLEQILQHNFLYDGDENEDPLWVDLKLIGNDYFKEGNYTEAIEAYSQALDVAPNQAVLLGNRAMCYLRLKEFECAREDAEDALDADNYENVKYYRLLSEAMMGMKDYGEAKEICVEGLELDQNDATLLSRRRTAEAMIQKEKAEYEKEKKRLELEERAKRGKEVFQEFYGAYLDETNNESGPDFSVGVDSDNDEIQITKVSSYTPSATSSSDHFGRAGIYRPHSAVISTEIQGRAKAGGITACKYLASEKLVESAEKLLATGDIKGALRDLKKADLLWERPKSVFTSGANQKALLAKTLKEAAVSFQINPRDIDAAYVIGRWEMMSDQDVILHWKRCVKMHPNEASFHFYLGTAYLTLERYNDSMDSIEAALAIEKKPDWFFWFAAPMIGLGMIDPAMSVYKEYVDSNPPDERFIPDAYYSIGALYFKKYDNAMATVYHELGQMAESVAIRFPAFYPKVLFDTAKETLRSGMKKNGYMESSVVASVMAQNMVECGFCKSIIKPTQLLSHKLSKCPRRTVVCELCNDRMVFDALQAHSQSRHAVAGKSKKKKGKGKKRAQSTAQNAPAPQPVVKTETSVTYPAPTRSDNLQELTTPKFHFAGAILEITKGKSTSNQTVFSLQTVLGQRWMLRVNDNLPPAGSSPLFDISKAIDGAAVDNSMLVFWRRPPPLETIDRRALAVPMEGEVYGQDVIIYILKCSSQALGFELCQLRHNKYMENGSLCAGCDNPAYPGEKLSTCSACKTVKYCSRDCQRTHWKRIHRHMCQNATLLSNCITMSEDVTPDERDGPRKQAAGRQQENATPANVRHEDTVYVDNTLEILEDILKNTKSKGDAWNGEDVIEYCMLPPRDLSRPGAISGSVRMFRRSVKGAKEFVAEFAVGYLTSSPTLLQQQELHYFFQIPPHNPLKLKCDGTLVYLDKCTVHTDDTSSRGFRLVMQMPLATYSLQAIAELLDYLLSNTNMYLS
ncbi:hypothetical protein PF004_g14487 [Phytophthora fragariae]|uniref:MYND-type domain-containing protein n=2 Tax=Phytophthora fragariae TaxID=53985 RepID=A0A6G0NP37_9STRA|nr:hypothetical protein PF004_g14487 [Phytophthora fragariae]